MKPFHTVVVTSPDSVAAEAALNGPLQRRNLPFNGKICPRVLSTTDPYDTRMGSGGGTLAALEYADLHNQKDKDTGSILIIHAGGQSSRCPTQMTLGKAWTDLPAATEKGTKRTNPTYILMTSLSKILQDLPSGSVVIAASDVLLNLPDRPVTFNGIDNDNVVGMAVPAPLSTAKNHGVFAISEEENDKIKMQSSDGSIKPVEGFFQKPTIQMMKKRGCTFSKDGEDLAWIDTGVIIFLPKAAESLRQLMKGELNLYTKQGVEELVMKNDSLRTIPIKEAAKILVDTKLELYSHLLLAVSTKESSYKTESSMLEQYLETESNADFSKTKLKEIFRVFSSSQLQVCAIPEGSFTHLGTTRELTDFLIAGVQRESSEKNCKSLSVVPPISLASRLDVCLNGAKVDSNCIIINSILDRAKPSHGDSLVGKGSIIEHCNLDETAINVGNNSVVSGLRGKWYSPVEIPSGAIFQMIPLRKKSENEPLHYVCMFLGIDDEIKKHDNCYGVPFEEFLIDAELTVHDLWDENDSNHYLWNARIHPVISLDAGEMFDWAPFLWISYYIESRKVSGRIPNSKGEGGVNDWEPFLWIHRCAENIKGINEKSIQSGLEKWKSMKRLSLSQIQGIADASLEFSYRAHLTSETKIESMKHVLRNRLHEELNFDFILQSISNGSNNELFRLFEALRALILSEFNRQAYDICSRCFMVLGKLLGEIAHNIEPEVSHHLRCDNPLRQYVKILKDSDDCADRLLSIETILEKSKVLLKGALNVCDTALIVECATEMEDVAFALTAFCIIRSKPDLTVDINSRPPPGSWLLSSAPVRVDLGGGWSDTPPLSYEFGGAVSCLAVTVNNQRPLSARCRRLKDASGIFLRTESRDINTGKLLDSDYVSIQVVKDLCNFRDPKAKCALLKCALIALGLISTSSIYDGNSESIINYINLDLGDEFQGIELISTSLLPHGSGMGTSSILASCVLSSLGGCLGLARIKDLGYLTQTVLDLEQLLSTGGGWQDQVGGLYGGLKLCTSKINELPVHVQVKEYNLSQGTINALNQRLLLAFTGQPRLAKNILQKVLRQWAGRNSEIMRTLTKLVESANQCAEVIMDNNFKELGSLMSSYWEMKKRMAGENSGVEPKEVADLLNVLTKEAIIDGGTLAGAGGGGFLALLLSEGKALEDVEKAVSRCGSLSKNQFTWFECNVSREGLTTSIQHTDAFQIQWHKI